jgi:hypothetical protein
LWFSGSSDNSIYTASLFLLCSADGIKGKSIVLVFAALSRTTVAQVQHPIYIEDLYGWYYLEEKEPVGGM